MFYPDYSCFDSRSRKMDQEIVANNLISSLKHGLAKNSIKI